MQIESSKDSPTVATERSPINRDSFNEELKRLANAWRTIVSDDRGFEVLMTLYGKGLANDPLCGEINRLRTEFLRMQASGSSSPAPLPASSSPSAPSSSTLTFGPVSSVKEIILSFLKSPLHSTRTNRTSHSAPLNAIKHGVFFTMSTGKPQSEERRSSHPRRKAPTTARRIADGKKHLSPREKWVKTVGIKHGRFKIKSKERPKLGIEQTRPIAGPSRPATPATSPPHSTTSMTGSFRTQPCATGPSVCDMSNMSAKAKGKQRAQDPEIEQLIPMADSSRTVPQMASLGEPQDDLPQAGPSGAQVSSSKRNEEPLAPIKGQKRARGEDDGDEQTRPRTRGRTSFASSISTSISPSCTQTCQEIPVGPSQVHVSSSPAISGPTNRNTGFSDGASMSSNAQGKQPAQGPQTEPAVPVAGPSRPQPLRRESTIINLGATTLSAGTYTSSSSGTQMLLPPARGKKRARSSGDDSDSARGLPRRRGANTPPTPPQPASPRPRTTSGPRDRGRRRPLPGRLGRGGAELHGELTPYILPPTPLRNSYVPPEAPKEEKPATVFSSVFQWFSQSVPK